MIDSKTLDPDFRLLIAKEPGGEHIKRCFSCGTCVIIKIDRREQLIGQVASEARLI